MPKRIKILRHHTRAAYKIANTILADVILSKSRYVISISGESGTGKTAIAKELSRILDGHNIKNILVQQKDYFRHTPDKIDMMRKRDLSVVGTSEVKLALLDKHIKTFKNIKTTNFKKPVIDVRKNTLKEETIRCKTTRVMIIEGTYTTLLKNTDKKVFLTETSRDISSGKKMDPCCRKVISIEHTIIANHKKLADIVIEKDFSLRAKDKIKKGTERICMLTIHGYVEPTPTLGKTDTGGQVVYVLELAKALAQRGIKVDIYTRKFQNRKAIEYINKNVRIIRIPCGGKSFIPKEKLLPHLDTFVKNMDKFIKKEGLRYDVIHSHYWDAGYVAMKLAELWNYFFIHTFHSLGAWKKENMGGKPKEMEKIYRFKERIKYEKQIFNKTRAIVMTSPDMVDSCKRFYNYTVTSKNHIILPAGVNTSIYRPSRKVLKEKETDVPPNYIFWVGRFDTNKGLDYLLKAFAEIVAKSKYIFLVIGGGSKHPKPKEQLLIKELHKIIKETQTKNRVIFTRYIPDKLMPAYYRKAKVFVLPSKFEPFGMTGAEALACGTPLIVSKRAGITKYLKHRSDCIIINPANKKEFANAFLEIEKNDTFRTNLSKNGAKTAKRLFGWLNIADKSADFYNKLLKEDLTAKLKSE